MKASNPPKPWALELLGLGEQVTFTHPDGRVLVWGDGQWWVGRGRTMKLAPGVPDASTMVEARTIGCAWLRDVEAPECVGSVAS